MIMAKRRYYRRRHNKTPDLMIFWGLGLVAVVAVASQASRHLEVAMLVVSVLLGIALLGVGVAAVIARRRQQLRRKALSKLKMLDIDRMDGYRFEAYMAEAFKEQGYTVLLTPASGDYGVDLVITKGKETCAVQIKRYKSRLGQASIREAVAGMAYYKCTSAMVVTNNYFTSHAKELAEVNNCTLVDRDKLAELLLSHKAA